MQEATDTISANKRAKITSVEDSTRLQIIDAKREDSGIYILSVFNSQGTMTASGTAVVVGEI